MNNEESIERFMRLASLWGPFVRKIHKQIVCERDADGVQHLKFARLFFDSGPFLSLLEVRDLQVETSSFYLHSAVEELRDVEVYKLLEVFLSKPASLPGLNGVPDDVSSETGRVSAYFVSEGSRSLPTRPNRWPSLTLTFEHSAPTTGRQFLDLELKALDQPFADLADLLSWASFEPSLSTAEPRSGRVEFILTPPVGIVSDVSIDEGRLSGRVFAATGVSPQSIKVGLVHYRVDETGHISGRRTSVSAAELNAKRISSDLVSYDFGGIETEGASCRLFLSVDGEIVSEVWAHASKTRFNRLFSLFKELGPSVDHFEDQFFERKNLENNFEQQVALLFEFLDNKTLHLGRLTGYSDEIDVIAQSRDDHLYLIECTISGIDNKNKLGKLKARVDSLVDARDQGSITHPNIQGVMVTSLPKSNVSEIEAQKAAEFGISVLAREEIEGLLSSLDPPPTPQALFERILRLVPKKPDQFEPTLF